MPILMSCKTSNLNFKYLRYTTRLQTLVKHEGHITGALFCKNFLFEEYGTIWQGFLKNGSIHKSKVDFYIPPIFSHISDFALEPQ